MIMKKFRDIVFEDIRSDYNNNGERSFLYGYMRDGKLKDKCEKNPAKEKSLVHRAVTDLMYNYGYRLSG